jgi:hypothetical protein
MISVLIAAGLAIQTLAPSPHELEFSVELQDPIVHHLRFSSSVVVGQPFSFEARSGEAVCMISGTVPTPVNGVYSFPVKIDEAHGKSAGMAGTQTLALTLNKPISGGPVASFVYMRTFKLIDPNAKQ